MARRFLTLLLAFAGMVLGIEGIQRLADWWNGNLSSPTLIDALLMAAVPLVAALWWRFLSPFGKKHGQCLACPPTEK